MRSSLQNRTAHTDGSGMTQHHQGMYELNLQVRSTLDRTVSEPFRPQQDHTGGQILRIHSVQLRSHSDVFSCNTHRGAA